MTMRAVLRVTAVLVALLLVLTGAHAGAGSVRDPLAPVDYTKLKGLSARRFPAVVRDPYMLRMKDGVRIYIEVTRPAAPGRYPVIAEISPYHGTIYQRDGVRILPENHGGGLVEYFPPRGYVVLMMDVRGTGRSGGCLDLMGPRDQSDAKAVIEWAAKQKWSNGRVGAIGHSYPGGTSVMSLSKHPKGLKTIVVSAGLGSMYEHQFQAGVPYNLQWAGPYAGYSTLTFERHQPGGDDFGNNTEYAACGLNSAPAIEGAGQLTVADQLSGRWSPWHSERDFRPGASSASVPVFVAHGVNDQAARIASIDWFIRRDNPGDKLWIGQCDHGIGCCPTRRGWQWTRAVHAWFDKHLQQRNVDTGPPVEAFVNDSMDFGGRLLEQKAIYTTTSFPPNAARPYTLYPSGNKMSRTRPGSGSVSFAGDPFGYFDNSFTNGVAFSTAPATKDQLFVGLPRLRLAASVTVPRVHLIATLYDEDPLTLQRRRITQFAINPELREGVKTAKVVVPAEKYVMTPPGWSMAHRLRKGHRLVLRVTTSDDDKVPFFAIDPNVTIYTGPGDTMLQLPLIGNAKLYKDSFSLTRPK